MPGCNNEVVEKKCKIIGNWPSSVTYATPLYTCKAHHHLSRFQSVSFEGHSKRRKRGRAQMKNLSRWQEGPGTRSKTRQAQVQLRPSYTTKVEAMAEDVFSSVKPSTFPDRLRCCTRPVPHQELLGK